MGRHAAMIGWLTASILELNVDHRQLSFRTALASATLAVVACSQPATPHADRSLLGDQDRAPQTAAMLEASREQHRSRTEERAKNARLDRRSAAEDAAPDAPPFLTTFRDESEFTAAVGDAALVFDFDRFQAGESLHDRWFNGMTIVGGPAEPFVVEASATWTPPSHTVADAEHYQLVAPWGSRVLSPGGERLAFGPDPTTEDDDLVLTFDEPVSAVAFTLLTPSSDGLSFTEVNVYSVQGDLLFKGQVTMERNESMHGASFPMPGNAFWGCVTREPVIARVEIDEQDSDDACPDANIGFADIRFVPASDVRASDLDGDGLISARDMALFQWLWESPDSRAHAWLDLNGDGLIDQRDRDMMTAAVQESSVGVARIAP